MTQKYDSRFDHGASFRCGDVIEARYTVEHYIAQSERCSILLCSHKDIPGAKFALKILNPELSSDKISLLRFKNEAAAGFRIHHRHVVQVCDFIESQEITAYAMEFIPGVSLRDYVEQKGPLSIDDSIALLTALCEGLRAIHSANVVHRDLSAGNVFLSDPHNPKILDFASVKTDVYDGLTQSGCLVGSIESFSPEYISEGRCDARSDIYALGLLAFFMLTGKKAFEELELIEALHMRVQSRPCSVTVHRPDCPETLSKTVQKMLRKDPAARFQSAVELLEVLKLLRQDSDTASYQSLDFLDDEDRSNSPRVAPFLRLSDLGRDFSSGTPDKEQQDTVRVPFTAFELPESLFDKQLLDRISRTSPRLAKLGEAAYTRLVSLKACEVRISDLTQRVASRSPDLLRRFLRQLRYEARFIVRALRYGISRLDTDLFRMGLASGAAAAGLVTLVALLQTTEEHSSPPSAKQEISVTKEAPAKVASQENTLTTSSRKRLSRYDIQSLTPLSLSQLNTQELLSTLVQIVKLSEEAPVFDDIITRRDVLQMIMNDLSRRSDQSATIALIRLTKRPDAVIRIAALKGLIVLPHADRASAIKRIEEMVNDEDYLVRGFAVKALSKLGSERALKILVKRKSLEPNPVIRTLLDEHIAATARLVFTEKDVVR